jgi:glycine dehydrogenase subunit 2
MKNTIGTLIFELGNPGRQGVELPASDVPIKKDLIPTTYRRTTAARLPEVSESEVVRHYTNLSVLNHHVDKGFYPLGSCTMKYNPKINEELASVVGFANLHPWQTEDTSQGALQLMVELSEALCEVVGLPAITLQPAAGAHGELTGILIMRAYHELKGNPRKKIIIPDSAHGTNPASIVIAGYQVVQIPSNAKGLVDLEALKQALDEDTAAFMITNPNTLGLFETQVKEIAKVVHQAGALLYMDGANMNALMGIARPGDMGFDVVHLNLHKTFSTPHGGGGPGSGPVAVTKELEPFLPYPRPVRKNNQKGNPPYIPPCNSRGEEDAFGWEAPRKTAIGRMHSFQGNFGIFVRALAYIRRMGGNGLQQATKDAILNANYLRVKLQNTLELPYPGPCMHEVVFSGDKQKVRGVKTLDIAKRLLDFGVHAPTVYFPLIVHEALMIEPTESESRQSLDRFIDIIKQIDKEVDEVPELLLNAPQNTPVSRLDEAGAARNLDVNYFAGK